MIWAYALIGPKGYYESSALSQMMARLIELEGDLAFSLP